MSLGTCQKKSFVFSKGFFTPKTNPQNSPNQPTMDLTHIQEARRCRSWPLALNWVSGSHLSTCQLHQAAVGCLPWGSLSFPGSLHSLRRLRFDSYLGSSKNNSPAVKKTNPRTPGVQHSAALLFPAQWARCSQTQLQKVTPRHRAAAQQVISDSKQESPRGIVVQC